MQLYHSWGGGGTSVVTLTCFIFSNAEGGDTLEVVISCFNFSNPRGGTSEVAISCFNFANPGGGSLEVPLTCFNFSNPGGVYIGSHSNLLQLFQSLGGLDRKSVRFTDSGWLSTAAASGQLC